MPDAHVVIVAADPAWPEMFEVECVALEAAIGLLVVVSRLPPRAEYAVLKHELAARYCDDREAYTEQKTDFIERILALTT